MLMASECPFRFLAPESHSFLADKSRNLRLIPASSLRARRWQAARSLASASGMPRWLRASRTQAFRVSTSSSLGLPFRPLMVKDHFRRFSSYHKCDFCNHKIAWVLAARCVNKKAGLYTDTARRSRGYRMGIEQFVPVLECLTTTTIVRSHKVSKPRDWYFELSYRFEIWQAHRQHCCRSACQIS